MHQKMPRTIHFRCEGLPHRRGPVCPSEEGARGSAGIRLTAEKRPEGGAIAAVPIVSPN